MMAKIALRITYTVRYYFWAQFTINFYCPIKDHLGVYSSTIWVVAKATKSITAHQL